jgi:hypothetical protein
MDRLEDRLCTTHSQLLELFCQTEQVFVCQICTKMGHTFHPFVPLKEECKVRTAQLVQQRIQHRQRMIQEIQYTIKRNNEDADKELSEGEQVLNALMRTIEKAW